MAETPPTAATPQSKGCPICGRPAEQARRPFCSSRCADVDLHRWLSGAYAVPQAEEDGEEAADDQRME